MNTRTKHLVLASTFWLSLASHAMTATESMPAPVACTAEKVEDVESRYRNAGDAERPALLFEVARCRYAAGRWAEFFGMAAYARAQGGTSLADEKLRLLDVLASVRHCRTDRARALLAEMSAPSDALAVLARRLTLTLDALPVKISQITKPSEKSKRTNGLDKHAMHWPVSATSENLRGKDPFRLQLPVAPECEETLPSTRGKDSP